MRRRRIAATVLAAALAAAGLAGCRTNVGVAARVDGHRISESDVNQYLRPQGVASDVAAASQGRPVSPRSIVLLWLIREQVFRQSLDRLKVNVTDGELAAQHDRAGSLLLGAQLSGSDLDSRIAQRLVRTGIKASFRDRLLRAEELEILLVEKRKIATEAQLAAAVRPTATRVSVSPRYGAWDSAGLQLGQDPVLPSFVVPQRGA